MIIFRQLPPPLPPYWAEGVHWQAELWDVEYESARPDAIAWLTIMPEFMVLDYVLVPDESRRKGLAKRLVKACQERWPGLMLTDAISPEGQALLGSLARG